MISSQAQDAIIMLREMKNQNAGMEMSAENVWQARAEIDKNLAIPTPVGIDTEIIDQGNVKGEYLHYNDQDPEKLADHILLFIHGGGFMTGSALSRRYLCASIMMQAKMDAFSIEYRQWPEAVHPAALNDCLAAYHWLIDRGHKADKIHIFGESAGAQLAIAMTLYLKDNHEQLPLNVCVFSPVICMGQKLESHISRADRDPMLDEKMTTPYFPDINNNNPYISPIYGNYQGFPQLSIHVGTEEILYDDSVLLEQMCRDAGTDVTLKIWEDLFHVFVLFPCPETDAAIREIAKFLRKD